MPVCVMQMQESEDEQLARAIAASLGQETTSLPPAQPPSQATAVSTSSALVRHLVMALPCHANCGLSACTVIKLAFLKLITMCDGCLQYVPCQI